MISSVLSIFLTTQNNESNINTISCKLHFTFCQMSCEEKTETAHSDSKQNFNDSIQRKQKTHKAYLSLVVGAHIQITENRLCSHFVVQLLVRRSVVS